MLLAWSVVCVCARLFVICGPCKQWMAVVPQTHGLVTFWLLEEHTGKKDTTNTNALMRSRKAVQHTQKKTSVCTLHTHSHPKDYQCCGSEAPAKPPDEPPKREMNRLPRPRPANAALRFTLLPNFFTSLSCAVESMDGRRMLYTQGWFACSRVVMPRYSTCAVGKSAAPMQMVASVSENSE